MIQRVGKVESAHLECKHLGWAEEEGHTGDSGKEETGVLWVLQAEGGSFQHD